MINKNLEKQETEFRNYRSDGIFFDTFKILKFKNNSRRIMSSIIKKNKNK